EEQVRRYPDRLAVKTRVQALTYAELNAAANRVAHGILAVGGEGAAPVALLCDRGAPFITALLGALKAGRIFVMLDRGYPPARLAEILEDAQADLIVASEATVLLAGGLAQGKLPVVNIDALDAGLSVNNPGLAVSPDAVVYLLYTSGSTGKPKG